MAAFHFELVSPDKLLFNGPVEDVLVPGVEGDFVVLAEHAPVMTTLRPGIVDIGEAAGKHTRLFVRGGFADVSAAGLILLAETAIPVDQLDSAHLANEIKNAEEDLQDAESESDKRIAQEKLDRLRELKEGLKL
jgi:F-type H+-transporting ATPase subunit epsilon